MLGRKQSEETRRKMSEAAKGRTFSEETRNATVIFFFLRLSETRSFGFVFRMRLSLRNIFAIAYSIIINHFRHVSVHLTYQQVETVCLDTNAHILM